MSSFSSTSLGPKQSNGTPRVLIIDDSDTDRYIYRRYLTQGTLRYEVAESEDGPSGLILAKTFKPDCILLDLNLGGESGYEVLQELVGDGLPAKRTVIILTVLSQASLKEGALSLGAADFLVKGKTDAVALDSAIRQAISKATRLKS
jgi:CheY-like chemotaxis protein